MIHGGGGGPECMVETVRQKKNKRKENNAKKEKESQARRASRAALHFCSDVSSVGNVGKIADQMAVLRVSV